METTSKSSSTRGNSQSSIERKASAELDDIQKAWGEASSAIEPSDGENRLEGGPETGDAS